MSNQVSRAGIFDYERTLSAPTGRDNKSTQEDGLASKSQNLVVNSIRRSTLAMKGALPKNVGAEQYTICTVPEDYIWDGPTPTS